MSCGASKLAASLLLAVALAGCWGDNDKSAADVEEAVREALAACRLHEVDDVRCRRGDGYWTCGYSSRERSGVITLSGGDHPEISTIC